MALTLKTPGVYIDEIAKLPPSVAPVDTAIPAFIGYTERAIDREGKDLTGKPRRIESLVEYEQYFGGPQPENAIKVLISGDGEAVNLRTRFATPARYCYFGGASNAQRIP
jgi:phage tail sheath protein FI